MLKRIVLVLLLCMAPVLADHAQVGPRQWVVGVPTKEFVHYAAPEGQGRQRMQNWCWAACIQMVLNWHGLHISQEEIVQRIFGGLVDAPAQPQQIMAALQGWAPDTRGSYSMIQADASSINPQTVLQDLDHRWPLIVGLTQDGGTGHAYVLTAAYYYLDDYNQPVIYQVTLRDPYPTQQSVVQMSMDELRARCTFATRVHVQRM